ncbi:T9SS type A sorting domain-containing protein [Gracilimonas sp.]|uniref:T9SS type A sorting domain-containing protein n=1 Tax=Gracilimonas sp. TaxID=1974203 RepID=UPI0028722208|nr:T9SS type A sorting domain-containing protein [Gracilimonas sp.]
MKTTTLTTLLIFALLAMSNLALAQDNLDLSVESFDADTSVQDWTTAGDAAAKPDEVTLEWAETAGVESSGAMRFGGVNADGEGGRAYIVEKVFTDIDFGGDTAVTVSVAIKSESLVGTNVFVLTDIGGSVVQRDDGIISELSDSEYTTFTFDHESISSSANSVKLQFNLAAGAEQDQGGTILVDDIMVTAASDSGGEELLTNGDFEAGDDGSWFGNALNIRTEGGNSYNFADVTSAGNAFDVNLSQGVEIAQGENYILSFDASTGSGNTRTMIAGIGLNEGAFTSATEEVTLTEETQTFTLSLRSTGFGSANSRVLFDMGADVGVVVIDNVSLKVDNSAGEDPVPETAAPTPPSRDAADVISLYSNAYDNISINQWSAPWDDSDIEDIVIEDNDTKKIIFTNFLGVDFVSSAFDASEMTHFHMDFWTPETDVTGKVFNPKWSNHAGGNGETNAFEYTYALSGDDSGTWVSVDVSIADFNAVNGSDMSAFAQFLITSNLDVAYLDNLYLYRETSTSIDDGNELPEKFTLNQNYPNPFNPTTNISYNIPNGSEVNIEVFNIQGQKVATLVNSYKTAGQHTVTFDASALASGVYTYRLQYGNEVQVRKMMLIK